METLTTVNKIVEELAYKVADMSLAEDGRKALDIAEKNAWSYVYESKVWIKEASIRKKTYRVTSYDCRNSCVNRNFSRIRC
jgi:hypothetical protein